LRTLAVSSHYYRVPPGEEAKWDGRQEFRLGSSLPEAYRTWADRLEITASGATWADVVDRYRLEVLPTKKPKTRESYELSIRRLLPVFGLMAPAEIRPSHAYRFYDLAKKARNAGGAKADVGVLRATLSTAVSWGLIDANPLMGQLRLEGYAPRDRYVEDWEVAEALSLPATSRGTRVAQPYIMFKLMTGLRRSDILRMPVLDTSAAGFLVTPGKTAESSGKKIFIEWIPELLAIYEQILSIPPRRFPASRLFTNRRGHGYMNDETDRANGFDSLWAGFMDRCIERTNLTERFQEKDIRAKASSDADSLEEARDLLGHASSTTTERWYRRKAVVVTPSAWKRPG